LTQAINQTNLKRPSYTNTLIPGYANSAIEQTMTSIHYKGTRRSFVFSTTLLPPLFIFQPRKNLTC